MDYTKGIPLRLQAFRVLLETHPELQDKVVFIQIAASSRGEIPSYDEQKREIEQIVGQINGDFGSPGNVPVHYQHRSSPANDLAALYRMADVALVTPLRDGMNLASKEYVASQIDRNGVLVLSEFAGAASELGEALRVNPWDVEGTAEIIYQALNMEATEKLWHMNRMSGRIKANDVHRWARLAISAIDRPGDTLPTVQAPEASGDLAGKLAPLLNKARNPVLILDYDGTLREFTERPEHATPTDSVLRLLKELEQLEGCTIVLSSGRDVWTMTEWFGGLNIVLMAEHGAWIRMRQTDEWHASQNLGDGSWKRLVLPILTDYVSRTPGSILEQKTAALVWHYRAAERDLGTWQARELTSQDSHQPFVHREKSFTHSRLEQLRFTVTERPTRGSAGALSRWVGCQSELFQLYSSGL